MKKLLVILSITLLAVSCRSHPKTADTNYQKAGDNQATSSTAILPAPKEAAISTKKSTTPPPAATTTNQTTTPPPAGGSAPVIAGCQIFPSSSAWNTDISKYPINSNSANYIASIGPTGHLHPDFGSNIEYGIPFITVPSDQAKVPINFTDYGDESDPGPYPIPENAPIEGGSASDGDRHVLVLQKGVCKLFELYNSHPTASGWDASSGAVFNLGSNTLRPEGWTSADAAGLPILPGLVRYDEVAAGAVNHAIRFTVSKTQKAYIHPATHYASSNTSANLPPMGLRVRLKADYDISKLTGAAKVIATAMKKYGMILADNGSNWYFTGASDSRWNDDNLNQLKTIPGSAFEAVDTGALIK